MVRGCVFWESQRVLQDRMGHFLCVSTIEGAFVEEEFVCGDTETPPIHLPRIAFLPDDLGGHVSHAASDACVQPAIRKVNGNVEIGDVSMTQGVEKNVVRFDVSNDGG